MPPRKGYRKAVANKNGTATSTPRNNGTPRAAPTPTPRRSSKRSLTVKKIAISKEKRKSTGRKAANVSRFYLNIRHIFFTYHFIAEINVLHGRKVTTTVCLRIIQTPMRIVTSTLMSNVGRIKLFLQIFYNFYYIFNDRFIYIFSRC